MTEKEIFKRIYVSVTTYRADWRKIVKDVRRLKISEISLFLTAVSSRERQYIYQALKNTSVKVIPHVHLKDDMKEWELDFLVSHFKTKVFSCHFQYFEKFFKNSKYKRKIFIENNNRQARIKNLEPFKLAGGICIDLAHLVEFQEYSLKDYRLTCQAVKDYKVGCNHLSAVLSDGQSWHYVKKLSELDYVLKIPKQFFSKYINLEVGNPIAEQFRFRDYLAKILAKKWNQKY